MMKKKTIKWRLSKLPTVEELQILVKDKIITPEEARDILFTEETIDAKALKQEIIFLRSLVEKLSNNSNTTIIKYIEEIKPIRQGWYQPYATWTSGGTTTTAGGTTITAGDNLFAVDGSCTTAATTSSFTDINTFS